MKYEHALPQLVRSAIAIASCSKSPLDRNDDFLSGFPSRQIQAEVYGGSNSQGSRTKPVQYAFDWHIKVRIFLQSEIIQIVEYSNQIETPSYFIQECLNVRDRIRYGSWES